MKKILGLFIIPLALFSLAVFAAPGSAGAQTTVTPYPLTITSPVSGTVWQTGSQQILKWTGFKDPHIPKIIAVLSRVNGDGTDQVNITDQQDGYFPYLGSYSIGSDFAGVKVNIPNTPDFIRNVIRENMRSGKAEYQLVLMAADSTPTNFADNQVMGAVVVNITTSSVSPTSTTTQSSLKILSPNGREVLNFQKGDGIVPITWSSTGIDAISTISIYLTDVQAQKGTLIAQGVANSGTYSWSGGSMNLVSGKYKIQIAVEKGIRQIIDASDEPFTVLANDPVTPPTPPITSCYTFTTNLQLGSRGADVAALQTYLIAKGYSISDLSVGRGSEKGYFGRSTYDALKKYQTAQGLPSTGFFGALTRASANAGCDGATPVTPTIPVAPSVCPPGFICAPRVIPGNGSISVVSPNGGENWQQGSVQNITWSSKDSAGKSVNIYAGDTLIEQYVSNSGVYQWNVGNANTKGGLANGKYTIRICSTIDRNSCDSSDAPFMITSPTTAQCPAGYICTQPNQVNDYPVVTYPNSSYDCSMSATPTTDPSASPQLFNIDFGSWFTTPSNKSGPAVVGNYGDFWNVVASPNCDYNSKSNLKNANGSNSQIYTQMQNLGGGWADTSGLVGINDPMLKDYNYPAYNKGGTASVTLNNVPGGSYDLYLYNKTRTAGQNGDYTVTTSSGGNYGRKAMTTDGDSYKATSWQENNQFVVFKGVQVSGGGSITISIQPGQGAYRDAQIAGLQLAPAGTSAAVNYTQYQGSTGVIDTPTTNVCPAGYTCSTTPQVVYPSVPTPVSQGTVNIITRIAGRTLGATEVGACVSSLVGPQYSNTAGCARSVTNQPAGTYSVVWYGGYPSGADTTKRPVITGLQTLGTSPITFYIDFDAAATSAPLVPKTGTMPAEVNTPSITSSIWDAVKEYWERN